MRVWSDRVEAILSDPEKAKVAAALYYLVLESINSHVSRKRQSAEDLLLIEATNISKFVDQERSR